MHPGTRTPGRSQDYFLLVFIFFSSFITHGCVLSLHVIDYLFVACQLTSKLYKMAWRSQGITGSNNIPLGTRRKFGGGPTPIEDGGYASPPDPQKRGRSPERGKSIPLPLLHSYCPDAYAAEPLAPGERRRKKRNRWGDAAENKAGNLMSLPTMIKANMTSEQLEAYALHLRIQEISEKLRINDVVPADGDR